MLIFTNTQSASDLYIGISSFISAIMVGASFRNYVSAKLFSAVIATFAVAKSSHAMQLRISTSPIPESVSDVRDIKPRIPGVLEVITLNGDDPPTKTQMLVPALRRAEEVPAECLLPGQIGLNNQNCNIRDFLYPSKTSAVNTEVTITPNSGSLRYKNVINMQDVTGLDERFTDELELPTIKNSNSRLRGVMQMQSSKSESMDQPMTQSLRKRMKKHVKARMVKFAEKFSDSGIVTEEDSWKVDTTKNAIDISKTMIKTIEDEL
uniref:Uncharacterized protein n=1 Tax=Amicula sp. isolate GU52X-4 cfCalB7 TaxID=3003489 RepID=A0A9E8Z766_9STRA|nr:hypothetical protein [Amicula sp. isolate GU52X-4 cfCalB7]WAK84985.1 hypothetical protein [Amicula sp. isolate GU52X-4 cfCalB7]